MIHALTVLISILTLAMMWMAGRKRHQAWIIGLANQVLWFTFIFATRQWGLLILAVALTVVYARNLVLWQRDEWQRQYAERQSRVRLRSI